MSFQQIIIIGNLGSDPEMRYTPSGTAVTNFSVATSRKWKNADGEQQEKTVWFRVTAWRQLAELTSQYLAKGRQVMIVGELEDPSVWTDKNGNSRASLEVTAREVRFLSGGSPSSENGNGQSVPAQTQEYDEEIPF